MNSFNIITFIIAFISLNGISFATDKMAKEPMNLGSTTIPSGVVVDPKSGQVIKKDSQKKHNELEAPVYKQIKTPPPGFEIDKKTGLLQPKGTQGQNSSKAVYNTVDKPPKEFEKVTRNNNPEYQKIESAPKGIGLNARDGQ